MSTDQFRRFTYHVTLENQDISEIVAQIKSEGVQKQLTESGILAFELYQKEQAYFLLIDASPNMNSTAISSVLSNVHLETDVQGFLEEENDGFSFESSPLERIYKMDQKVVYPPEEGQLKTEIGVKKRFVWTLFLEEDPELIAEYKKVHGIGQAWPEITANMKLVGVKDMEIYLHNEQAFLIMDTKPDFDLEAVGPKWQKLPRETEWQEYVAKFQRIDPESSIQEKWKDMVPVYN